jgi:hypothetical protein
VTLEYLRQTLGEEEVARVSLHRPGTLQSGSKTIAPEHRALAPAHRLITRSSIMMRRS